MAQHNIADIHEPPIAECTHVRCLLDGPRDSQQLVWYAQKGHKGAWFTYSESHIQNGSGIAYESFKDARENPGTIVKLPSDGGSITVSNKRLKNELHLPVVTHTDARLRLCAAHSAYLLVRTVRPELKGRDSSQASFEKELPGTLDPQDDPTSDDIKRVVFKRGVGLEEVYNLSPHALIQRGKRVFLVHMSATVGGESVLHFFIFDANTGCLLDPDASGAEQVEDSDRCLHAGNSKEARKKANIKAMSVFYKAYSNADHKSIKIDRVWEGVRV